LAEEKISFYTVLVLGSCYVRLYYSVLIIQTFYSYLFHVEPLMGLADNTGKILQPSPLVLTKNSAFVS